MNNKIARFIGFIVILYIYVTLLITLSSALPIIFLTGLLAWIIIRRPITYPDRIKTDIKMFSNKVGEVACKIFEILVKPLSDDF